MLFDLITELARPVFQRLLEEAPIPPQQLGAQLRAHTEALQARGGEVDGALAGRLQVACEALLASLTEFSGDTTRQLVQAACRYYVLEDDAQPDSAPGGLQDDLEVVAAVARHLGLDDVAGQLDA